MLATLSVSIVDMESSTLTMMSATLLGFLLVGQKLFLII